MPVVLLTMEGAVHMGVMYIGFPEAEGDIWCGFGDLILLQGVYDIYTLRQDEVYMTSHPPLCHPPSRPAASVRVLDYGISPAITF